MGELWRRLWFLLNRRRFERELQDEMDAHREMKGEAEAPFGNSLRLRDEAVDAWGWRPLERVVQDVRFAARLLRRSPAFTLTALTVLALGVGVNLAAFQLFDQLALSPRPVRDPDTLVNLHRRSPTSTSTTFSYPAFAFYRQHTRLLNQAMAIVSAEVTVGDDQDRHVPAAFVSGNYFAELGGTPLLGRLLHPADDSVGRPAVVVLSEAFWRSRFGADPGVIGRRVHINGRPFEAVGVVSAPFAGLEERGALWMPIHGHAAAFPGSALLEDWNGGSVDFYGRAPREGWTAVEAELRTLAATLRQQQPAHVWTDEWLELRDASRLVSLDEAAPAFALIGALVGLVLLAACMNLGLLVMARTVMRDREFSIRLSVGATRGRLVRQLLTEHLLLGVIGAAGGCLVAYQASNILRLAIGTPSGIGSPFNVRTVLIAALLGIISAVTFGFAPVWQTIRPAAARGSRARSVLLALQVTAASALLIVSGLLVRGVTRTTQVSPGFDYEQTLVADPDLMSHGMSPEAAGEYLRRAQDRVGQASGVRGVAISSLPPLGNRVTINGERTVFYGVTPSYFEVLQIPVRRGRLFAADERGVVMISESLAARRFPSEDPLGKTFDGDTIIGVVGDARTVRLNESGATECYRPVRAADMPTAVLVARVDGPPRAAVPAIRSILQSEKRGLVPQVTTLEEALAAKLAGARQAAQLVSVLGGCALLLAVTGLGGIVAFTVSQRLREIGVRLALGAGTSDVLRAVLRQFSGPVLVGAVSGSLLAALAGFVLAGELYGVSSFDPFAHLGAIALFTATAAAAALPSLRRALRVDPVQTLRHD